MGDNKSVYKAREEFDPFMDLMHRMTLEAISTFSKQLIGAFKEVLARQDMPFDELTFRANPSKMKGGNTTTAYWKGEPILEWTEPVIYEQGTTLKYVWEIKKLPRKTPLE